MSPYILLSLRQNTAFPVVPVHTFAEFDLFTKMLKTAKYFVANSKQPTAAHASRNVDFKMFAKDWTDQVHLAAGEERSKDQRIYYKLPEQLEHHYQVWAASRARAATLTNTVQMRQPFTAIISDPTCRARVLPAINFIDSNASAPLSNLQKGKGREMESPQRSDMVESHNEPTLTNSDQIASSIVPESMSPVMQKHVTAQIEPLVVTRNILPPVPHGLGSNYLQLPHFAGYGPATATTSLSVSQLPNISRPKKHGPKKCAACKKYKCQRVDDCAGSGGHMRCHCTNHPQLQALS